LIEGVSIRSVERMTGIHRDTIMRLGAPEISTDGFLPYQPAIRSDFATAITASSTKPTALFTWTKSTKLRTATRQRP
jgi:hypothetical protein